MTNAPHANGNAHEYLTLHFKIRDFNAWRTSCNGNEKGRASAGITNGRVFRGADGQNEVIVLQDRRRGKGPHLVRLISDDLKAAMQKSGIILIFNSCGVGMGCESFGPAPGLVGMARSVSALSSLPSRERKALDPRPPTPAGALKWE
jgi:hypothetical protein